MKKLKLPQCEVDGLVVVERFPAIPTVYGVGLNDVGFRVRVDNVFIWQYILWKSMLERCFCEKAKVDRPTYKGVTCCVEWLSFGNFLEWANKEVGYKGKPVGFELDKDIVIRGNKIYSPEACSLVPKFINCMINTTAASRGECPVGVSRKRGTRRFQAHMNCIGVKKYLGYYDTAEEAFAVYKKAKESQIKEMALEYKAVLKPVVFDSLMNWEVSAA